MSDRKTATHHSWRPAEKRAPRRTTRRSITRRMALGSALMVLGASTPVSAQAPARSDSSAADVAAARELGTEGVRLAQEGKCAEAIDYLTRATRLYVAPTLLVPLGECHILLG